MRFQPFSHVKWLVLGSVSKVAVVFRSGFVVYLSNLGDISEDGFSNIRHHSFPLRIKRHLDYILKKRENNQTQKTGLILSLEVPDLFATWTCRSLLFSTPIFNRTTLNTNRTSCFLYSLVLYDDYTADIARNQPSKSRSNKEVATTTGASL